MIPVENMIGNLTILIKNLFFSKNDSGFLFTHHLPSFFAVP